MLLRHKVPDAQCQIGELCINLALNIPEDLVLRVRTRNEVEDLLLGADPRARVGELLRVVGKAFAAAIERLELCPGQVRDIFADVRVDWVVREGWFSVDAFLGNNGLVVPDDHDPVLSRFVAQ